MNDSTLYSKEKSQNESSREGREYMFMLTSESLFFLEGCMLAHPSGQNADTMANLVQMPT